MGLKRLSLQQIGRAVEAQVPQKAARDLWYRLRFGADAPRSDALIYVTPAEVNHALGKKTDPQPFRRQNSGGIVPGDWDQDRVDIEGNTKLISCRMRWEQGAEWSQTPIFQRMVQELGEGKAPDGCRSEAELRARYAALDRLFEQTAQRGRLLSKRDLPDYLRREHGGILVHVGRDGTCLRSGGGAHRFAIARILDLPQMPAQIGAVHPQAVRDGHVRRLMRAGV